MDRDLVSSATDPYSVREGKGRSNISGDLSFWAASMREAPVQGSFNLLNTPNFGSPQPLLGIGVGSSLVVLPNFGRAGGIAASQIGGLNRLYQVGGPRSHQFTIRASF